MTEPVTRPARMPCPGDGLWARLTYTPLRDALRGRLTARLDARRVIAAAGLPDDLAALAWQTTRRTRLWRSEKVDVAGELAGHFRDGLAAGRDPASLARDFGDPRAAARLIRRAKIRSRAWPLRALRRAVQGVGLALGLLVAGYLALTLRYLLASPHPSRDFIAELNASPLAVPDEERAWPLYRQALLELRKPAAHLVDGTWDIDAIPHADDNAWTDLLAFVEQNGTPLRLTREAAARPRMGYVFGAADDREWLRKAIGRDSVLPRGGNGPLWHLPLQHVQELGNLRLLLLADARGALEAGDREALLADIRALLGLAEHFRDPPPLLVVDLHALATFNAALRIVAEALDEHAELLTDDDLRQLAAALRSFGDGEALRPRLDGERMMLDDLWQQIYTDDGQGDGYLTANGLWTLIDLAQITPGSSRSGVRERDERVLINMLGPAMTAAVAGRREMADLSQRLLDQLEQEGDGPMWTWTASNVEKELHLLQGSTTQRIRYMPILLMLPGVQGVAISGEQSMQRRDAMLAAIALEQFRRRTGQWPAALADLTPDLLPAVPPDRFTGQPLPYRLVDGRPLLYSFATDRTDQGGKPSANDRPPGWLPPGAPGILNDSGDWILWPPKSDAP